VTVGADEVIEDTADEVQDFDSVRYGNYQEANKDELGRYVLPLTQGMLKIDRTGLESANAFGKYRDR
jgi:hypothetical protein